MSTGSSSEAQGTQSRKAPSRRAHRGSQKRPVLVTAHEGQEVEESRAQTAKEAVVAPVAIEEKSSIAESSSHRGKPRFFANIGKTEESTDKPEADPKAARLARALRGKSGSAAPEAPVKERKQAAKVIPARPSSGFKMRYIWGMVLYLLVADFLGVYITNFMQANHMDSVLFVWGPIRGTTSTLVFLAILVIILVVMARFDLLPRSFSGMYGNNTPTRESGSRSSKTKDAPTFETKASQPTLKQGVQGTDDDLYREYRENQRYFQKRDRKR